MDHSPTNGPPDSAAKALLDEAARLAPALEGFPVHQLLDAWATAEQRDRTNAYLLIDRCLVGWIASLQGALGDYPQDADGPLLQIQARQQGALDALTSLKSALKRAEVLHPNRGQAC